jgi:hypothetical protein
LLIWHAWERRNTYRGLVGAPEGKIALRRVCIDGKMILQWVLNIQNLKMWA